MKILHLRHDRRFARVLHDISREQGHDLRHAGDWMSIFASLPAGPYQLALLSLPRPGVLDVEHAHYLSAATGNLMEIYVITGDKGLAAHLQGKVFKVVPPTIEPHLLYQGVQEVAARARRPGVDLGSEWQELAPGIALQRGLTRWNVARGAVQVQLTPHEIELLSVLLAADGHAVSSAELAGLAGATKPLSENALQVAIRRLRAKIEVDPGRPQHLMTVPRHGYVWQP